MCKTTDSRAVVLRRKKVTTRLDLLAREGKWGIILVLTLIYLAL